MRVCKQLMTLTVCSTAILAGCSYERQQHKVSDPEIFYPNQPAVTLEQAQALHAIEGRDEDAEDLNRYTAMREAALSFGMRAAMASMQEEIADRFIDHEETLDRIYDFRRIVIPIKGNDAVIIPPVIEQTDKSLSIADDGNTATITQTTFKIIKPARIAATAPRWKDFISRGSNEKVDKPPVALLPKTEIEQQNWAQWVAEGWEKGIRMTTDNWQQDQSRLKREFTGMLKYLELVERGQVRSLYLATSDLGITGEGTMVEIGKAIVKITDPAHLVGEDGEYLPIIIDAGVQ